MSEIGRATAQCICNQSFLDHSVDLQPGSVQNLLLSSCCSREAFHVDSERLAWNIGFPRLQNYHLSQVFPRREPVTWLALDGMRETGGQVKLCRFL